MHQPFRAMNTSHSKQVNDSLHSSTTSTAFEVHRLFSLRDNGVLGQFANFHVKSNTAVFSSKVKLRIFDANSSWKSIFDNESFEFQVKLNTTVFWSKVKCRKFLQKRCITPSLKENSLCSIMNVIQWYLINLWSIFESYSIPHHPVSRYTWSRNPACSMTFHSALVLVPLRIWKTIPSRKGCGTGRDCGTGSHRKGMRDDNTVYYQTWLEKNYDHLEMTEQTHPNQILLVIFFPYQNIILKI